MIVYSDMGWIYINDGKIFLKKEKKKFLYYLINLYKIKKIKKNYILLNDYNINLKLTKITINEILWRIDKKIDLNDLTLTKFYDDYKAISWAMTVENDKIKEYDKEFEISFWDIGYMVSYPILFKIKNIKIKKYENKIEIEYSIEDVFLVYLFINEWFTLYENNNILNIKIGIDEINWKNKKNCDITYIFKKLIINNRCEIKNENENFDYEIDIKYNKKNIIFNF